MEGAWTDHRQWAMRGAEGGARVSAPSEVAGLRVRGDSGSNWCHTLLGGGGTGWRKKEGDSQKEDGKVFI